MTLLCQPTEPLNIFKNDEKLQLCLQRHVQPPAEQQDSVCSRTASPPTPSCPKNPRFSRFPGKAQAVGAWPGR